MTITRYSDKIEGDRGNYKWDASFDLTGGYLGITQAEDGKIKDRVLLSPKQVNELAAFLEQHKTRPRRSRHQGRIRRAA